MVLYINYIYNIHVVTAYMYDQQKIEKIKIMIWLTQSKKPKVDGTV